MEGTLAMGRARALAILSLSIAGVVISSYLIYADHRLGRDPAWESLCTVSERFDCNAAIRSPYSSIFGVPLSVLAACFYMLTALLAAVDLWAPRRTWPRSPAILLLLGSSIACVWSVGLAGVSAFAVRSWCLLCIALYVVNFCMLLVAVSALRATKETIRFSLSSERARLTKHPFPAVACVIVASVVLVAVRNNRSESARLSVACEEAALAAREGRPLELVVYSDFQCPHCKALDSGDARWFALFRSPIPSTRHAIHMRGSPGILARASRRSLPSALTSKAGAKPSMIASSMRAPRKGQRSQRRPLHSGSTEGASKPASSLLPLPRAFVTSSTARQPARSEPPRLSSSTVVATTARCAPPT
jgi:uncharacterized membrane protein